MNKFDTHGGTFAPQGFMQIEAGGTHEENPNGGVQVGVDPNGIPNMVEEDENIYQDFVYSNQILADEDILKEFNLPEKYKGKSYSDIVNEYVDPQRPNDPVTNRTMNAMLVRLADAQEEQKKRQEQKEIEYELANMSPEEIAELENYIAQMEQGNAPQEQAVQPQMFETGGPKESTDKNNLFVPWLKSAFGFSDDYINALGLSKEELDARQPIIIKGEPILLPGTAGASTVSNGAKLSAKGLKALEGAKKRAKAFEWLKKLPGLTSKEEAAKLAASELRTASAPVQVTAEAAKAAEEVAKTGEAVVKPSRHIGRKIGISALGAGVLTGGSMALRPIITERQMINNMSFAPSDSVYSEEPVIDWLNVEKKGGPINTYGEGDKLDTSSRYAGAITSGLFGLYNAFQRPDVYRMPHVAPTLMRTRLNTINPVYTPQNPNIAVNDVIASGAGTARALRNSGLGPSTGATLIALDNNIGRNIGSARAQAVGANSSLLNNVISQINANRQAEAQVGLNREQYNARMLYDAALRNAQNNLALQQLNYGAEGQHYGAIGSQIDQVAQALSDIGRENMAMNMVNNGYDYEILPDGTVRYFRKEKCGGLLKKYKK